MSQRRSGNNSNQFFFQEGNFHYKMNQRNPRKNERESTHTNQDDDEEEESDEDDD